MRHLWLRGFERIETLKPRGENSGYDLVLEANGVVQHIQLKSSHHSAATPDQEINVALAEKPSGCVIWLRFDPKTLDFGPFLWFGSVPKHRLPDLTPFRIARHTKPNSEGIKTERPNIRYVPKAHFSQLETIEEVVAHLFG